jgi:predicted extracellular nuclease
MATSTRPRRWLSAALTATLLALAGAVPAAPVAIVGAASSTVVISQVYGGGGNLNAVYTHDFIELYNLAGAPVSLAGWSLQYGSTTGQIGAQDITLTPLSGSIPARGFVLVQEAQGTGGTTGLPAPFLTDPSPIAMSATGGKVALVNTTTPLGCGATATPCVLANLPQVIDFVGWDGANLWEGVGAAPGTNNTTAIFRDLDADTPDTDSNNVDFFGGSPAPRASGDVAPSVLSTDPAEGATVPADGFFSVTFTEDVTFDATGLSLVCTSGSSSIAVSGGPRTFDLSHGTLAAGDACSLTIPAGRVTDLDGIEPSTMAGDFTLHVTVASATDPCTQAFTPIPAIQGDGETLTTPGSVTTQGIVVGDYEGATPALRGFYLQAKTGDGNDATSDGIFVFNGNANSVSLGQEVRVSGSAAEFQGQSQITASTIRQCGTGAVQPTDVLLPFQSATFPERYEGMLVRLHQTLFVTEHFQLGRFGQVVVSSEARLRQPTAEVAPGPDAAARQLANDRNRLILDGARNDQNPDPIRFGRGGQPLSAENTLRGGDTVTDFVGVMTFTFSGNASASGNAYRVRPVDEQQASVPSFVAANPRPTGTPKVGGTVRVAGMNLLNYFDTNDNVVNGNDTVDNCRNGVNGTPTDCRGADTDAEFARQAAKTVAAIRALDADVIGVNELENDGYGSASAIADLVHRLNAAADDDDDYAFIDVDAATGRVNALGVDAIRVAMLYRPARITPFGTTAALDSAAFVNGGDATIRTRPSLAQAFVTHDGGLFVVAVNHFKSKGSACDGQGTTQPPLVGFCDTVRTNSASALAAWLVTDPTGVHDADTLIVGDLNSYAREAPVATLEAAGFTNLIDARIPGDPYSYVFDGQWGYLDYALGSASIDDQVTGVGEVHTNADEPSVLDYNTDFKSTAQQQSLYAPDRFRISDHDPVLVGLDIADDRPTVDAGGPYQVEEHDAVTLAATGGDPTGQAVSYAWDLDGNGSFETSGASASFSAALLEAPRTVVVKVRATDESGLTRTADATIHVIWDFGGFQAPLDPAKVNVVKAGSAVPVKFSLDGPQGLSVLQGVPTVQFGSCASGDPEDDVETTANGGGLAYDAATDTYTYVWKTQKAWAGRCGTVVVALSDGTSHTFDVRFKT